MKADIVDQCQCHFRPGRRGHHGICQGLDNAQPARRVSLNTALHIGPAGAVFSMCSSITGMRRWCMVPDDSGPEGPPENPCPVPGPYSNVPP